ncbi:MAG TPA: VTT domain-containing protein [Bryobacteraceae bacterium]|nr:VTT domain-containing protein [Bryobacteraceae bacterium]
MLAKITAALVAYGPWGVFLIGVIDSMGIPLPATMDALLILIAVKAPERAYFTAAMAILGSMGGNLGLFLAARYGVRRFARRAPAPGKPQRFREWFSRYGLLTVFIPAVTPVLPLPLKVFVISAGVLHTPLVRFTIVVLVARVIRYFGEAYLGIRLGADAQGFLQRNAWTLVGIALGAAFVLYFLVRWNDRRASLQPPS